MSVTQTVDIPDNHRLVIDVPREVPAGRAVITFTPAADQRSADLWSADQNLDTALERIWALCGDSFITVDSFLEMRRRDNELEEQQYRRFFPGTGDAD